MAFSIITIRSHDGGGDELFPRLDPETGVPAFDSRDGSLRHLSARALEVYTFDGGVDRVLSIDDLTFQVVVTESRIVIWTRKFDKGGGWRGFGLAGLVVAGAANTVSHVRAASRRKGKCLVGHIRYPWLIKVGYRSKQGVFSRVEEIRLVVHDGTDGSETVKALDLRLSSNQSAQSVATDIARRAIDFRLSHHRDLHEDERRSLESTRLDGFSGTNGDNSFAMVALAGGWVVRSDTAHYPEHARSRELPDESELSSGEDEALPGGEETGDDTVAEDDGMEPVAADESTEEGDLGGRFALFCYRCGRPFTGSEMVCEKCGAERRSRTRVAAPTDRNGVRNPDVADDVPEGASEGGGEESGARSDEDVPNPTGTGAVTLDDVGDGDTGAVAADDSGGETLVGAGVGDGDTGAVAADDSGEETSDEADVLALSPDTPAPSVAAQEGRDTISCPSCGRELPSAARFCARCGEAIPTQGVARRSDST